MINNWTMLPKFFGGSSPKSEKPRFRPTHEQIAAAFMSGVNIVAGANVEWARDVTLSLDFSRAFDEAKLRKVEELAASLRKPLKGLRRRRTRRM